MARNPVPLPGKLAAIAPGRAVRLKRNHQSGSALIGVCCCGDVGKIDNGQAHDARALSTSQHVIHGLVCLVDGNSQGISPLSQQ